MLIFDSFESKSVSENVSSEPLKLVLSRHPAVAGTNESTLASSDGVTICAKTELLKKINKKNNKLSTFNLKNM